VAPNQQIFRFDVAVDDPLAVAVTQAARHVKAALGCTSVAVPPAFFQVFEQIPLGHELENEVDIRIVVKVPIEALDVPVYELTLVFDFTSQLVLNVESLTALLLQHLHRHDVLGALFSRKINARFGGGSGERMR
jgi:hypothetical protein